MIVVKDMNPIVLHLYEKGWHRSFQCTIYLDGSAMFTFDNLMIELAIILTFSDLIISCSAL
jgi:hypothetical protein